ncbi:hypothetical protein Lepto7376_2355 [[Leptolyngbya] sp. PCC 7376]|uniref:hypothetical protein n=1 Tax=[Leptolyngbya] sp. PCC 7376 TaxID=111781 RepID=UPI00029F2DC2|nr:hypothetical protein [[Leptolyngbya] sp. PCC 7376]AFY38639.1 hypothetical protein Lepto7376_2355 [[Leptolyngbya] sp. PCC 7376]
MFKSNNFLSGKQKGFVIGAIALSGFGIMSTALACELILPDQKIMAQSNAQTPTEISGAHPLAIALSAAQQDGYVSDGTWKETIDIQHDSAESPTSATVVITQTGFLDDSVKGHQFTVQMSKGNAGNWVLEEIDKEWLCYRGMSDSGLCL